MLWTVRLSREKVKPYSHTLLLLYFNPLTHKNDHCLISPYSKTAQSNMEGYAKKGSDQGVILLIITIENVWRISMLMLGFKEKGGEDGS